MCARWKRRWMRDTAFEYIRRDPQSTVLYRVVAEKLETFLIAAGEWQDTAAHLGSYLAVCSSSPVGAVASFQTAVPTSTKLIWSFTCLVGLRRSLVRIWFCWQARRSARLWPSSSGAS